MQAIVKRRHAVVIERPIEEVREQFGDMRYHALTNVHPEIRFDLSRDADEHACRYTATIRIAGMPQTDEITNTILSNGDIRSDYVAGMNAGGSLLQTFTAQGGATRVELFLEVPLRGAKALIAPIFSAAAQAALVRGLAQDKRDLEAGNYERYKATKG